ncbi:ABC transporter substrate-binding protein [Pleionea sp. CnH1-48]|uniref:substrate-binding periplasmic protein n=1 Tax=Pleionea sp. CnH1-48 TaxID=2954494 RepID=UPI0020976ADD|nr:transporter substrate-binding domain-containing protein [Pleionea sp. CnH1-48]MCO7226538.1 transporter substrate-binding domain-containing protein [Pleionea sp. CnH1-48]
MSRSAILLLSVLIFLLTACNSEAPQQKQQPTQSKPAAASVEKAPKVDCTLNMGWDPWEPYMYLSPDDSVSGLDIEIVRALANKAGCDVKFIQDDWMSLLQQLSLGNIDLVAGASVTEKRKEYALFSAPYRQEEFALYIRNGEGEKFAGNLSSILSSGKKIGITTDYIYGEEVNNFQDDPKYAEQFIDAAVGEVNYYNLLQHNIDAFLEDPFVATYNIKRKGIVKQIEPLELKIHSGDVHLMFSIKSVDHRVVERFNEALASIKQDGSYQAILNKYSM